MKRTLGRPRDLVGRLRGSVDWVVLVLTVSLVVLALLNLNSAGQGDWSGKVAVQLRWVGLGTVGMCLVTVMDYRALYRGAYAFYAGGLVLLALLWIIGVEVKNANRWLGIGEYRIGQPSEIMKLVLVIGIARYLHDLPTRPPSGLRAIVVPAGLVLVPVGLIVIQPDLGTAVLMLLVALTVMVVTELRLRSILVILSACVLSFGLGWWRYMAEYQRERIDVWLNPELYADDEGYQTIQGMITVGNGGFLGRGIRQGTQNVLHFLPERYTDFPFAVYAEEWGFAGGALVLALFLGLILWAVNVASQTRDRFGAVLCIGVAALFFWHVIINVGMVLQLLPVTGVTLPLFSFGGSSVLTMMLSLGVLMSVSRQRGA